MRVLYRLFRHILPQPRPVLSPSSRALARAMSSPSQDSEVLHSVQEGVGVAVLNRPKALNSLNTSMVEAMYELYSGWDADPGVACLLLRGAGDRAFCAGGDVKSVVQLGLAGRVDEATRFFRSEYRLNHLIAKLSKPHVAFMDGITMGGGAGVSVHGAFRVATERTVFAMPECSIGLFPDVGASFFLPRLPASLGLYLAITGARLQGVDVRHATLATHYIHSRHLPQLQQCIAGLGPAVGDPAALGELLTSFERREGAALPEGALLPARGADISYIFGGRQSVEEVHAACAERGGQWGADTLALMTRGSPTSQKVAFEQLRRGARLPLEECLRMENRMAHHAVSDVASDFYAGVQAALITRSGSPAWVPPSLKDVSEESVAAFFRPVPPECELDLPPPAAGRSARL